LAIFLAARSCSLICASAILVRVSISALTLASLTRASASRSLVSWSVETMRITLPFSTFWRPLTSRMVSSACSQVTLRSEIDTFPLTSSPATMFRPLSAARMRRRLTTSASLKSMDRSRPPLGGVVVTCAITAGWGTGVGAAAVAASVAPPTLAGSGFGFSAFATGLGASTLTGSGLTASALATGLGASTLAGSGLTASALATGLGASTLAGSGALGASTRAMSLRTGSGFTASALMVSGLGSVLAASTFLGAFGVSGLAGSLEAVAEGSSNTVSPSALCSIRYPTLRVSSTTTRAVPAFHWLPRISLIGGMSGFTRVLSHAYAAPVRSITRRAGVSMSEAE
jgi:hypothetical protein